MLALEARYLPLGQTHVIYTSSTERLTSLGHVISAPLQVFVSRAVLSSSFQYRQRKSKSQGCCRYFAKRVSKTRRWGSWCC